MVYDQCTNLTNMTNEDAISLEQPNYSTDRFLSNTAHSNSQYLGSSVHESIQVHTERIIAELDEFDKKFYREPKKTLCRM